MTKNEKGFSYDSYIGKKLAIEQVFEMVRMVDLANKGFKVALGNMLEELKETILEELKEGMTIIS